MTLAMTDPRMFPLAAVKFVIGRAFVTHADAEQRAEGVERVKPAIEAESELIQVGLEVLRAHAVVAAAKPAFQVRKDKVDDGQALRCPRYRFGWIFIECDGHNFHERTKEQAARDRQRDREIQGAGYPVLRFTGSEIHRDLATCASQVFTFLDDRIESDWLPRGEVTQ